MEAVFLAGIFRLFPVSFGQILALSSGKRSEFSGKTAIFWPGILLPFLSISGVFLQKTVFVPGLSNRFRPILEGGMIVLGTAF
jgi:hypothetical protein